VSIPRAGEFHLEGDHLDLEGVVSRLIDLHMGDPERRLVIRADQKLPYSQIRSAMARIQKIGFPGVNFMVGERHGGDDTTAATEDQEG
jgi:biopolymer transport protein ExbD